MHMGFQIEAPEGWHQMVKGVTYYFLKSHAEARRVLLAYFQIGEMHKDTKAHLLVMPRKIFEDGIASEDILPLDIQLRLPPWLAGLEDFDLTQIDSTRPKAAILHSERVEDRFLKISPTLRDLKIIFSAKYPEAELNHRASLCTPRQHETRFRLWVLTYLCFGQDMWMLLGAFNNIGHYDRLVHKNTKFGAPSLAYGKKHGNNMSIELIAMCVKYFIKHADLGKRFSRIYETIITEDFRCKTAVTKSGMRYYIHPEGKPFPSFWQFKYSVLNEIGIETVQIKLYGAVRHRAKVAASKGSFTEDISNLMENVDADGYYTKERPRGYVEGTSLPPLCCVTSRDLLSGKKLGIGFSFGNERSTAYRMMLFCMAVPKDYFCMLMGIPFVKGEWVNEGIPAHFSVDRGPGGRKQLIKDLEKRFPIRDLAPSWMGQSKANIESSHPRDVKIDGQPTYLQSDLTPIELARREIMALISYNHTANMEDRFEPDRELALVPPTPISRWIHYDNLFRNDAMPISIPESVRTFLTPMEFDLRDDGIWLDQRKYGSDALDATGIRERIARSGELGAKINGYILDMCLRHIWVEVDRKLLLLDAKLRLRDDENNRDISFAELEQWNEARRNIGSAFREHQHAASSEFMSRFKEDTGKSWDSTKRRTGKPKRDAMQKQEESEARQATSNRKKA